jgi:ATP-dependent protease HslVU (ClpYQ) ATPase subunit
VCVCVCVCVCVVKVEATKYTEIGFHGKDVDQIIRDLVEVAITMTNKMKQEKLKAEVALAVEEQILDMLVGKHAAADSRASFRGLLRNKSIEMRPVTIEVPVMEKGLGGGNLSDPKLATGMDLTEIITRVAKGLHPNPNPNPHFDPHPDFHSP